MAEDGQQYEASRENNVAERDLERQRCSLKSNGKR